MSSYINAKNLTIVTKSGHFFKNINNVKLDLSKSEVSIPQVYGTVVCSVNEIYGFSEKPVKVFFLKNGDVVYFDSLLSQNRESITLSLSNLGEVTIPKSRINSSLVFDKGTKVLINEKVPLSKLKELNFLNFRDKALKNLDSILPLKKLEYLDLTRTKITDIKLITKFKKLKYLNLSGTKVKDLSPLKELNELSHLYLFETEVIDIEVFKKLKKLRFLGIKDINVAEALSLKKILPLCKIVDKV